jgi:hypothetical protein
LVERKQEYQNKLKRVQSRIKKLSDDTDIDSQIEENENLLIQENDSPNPNPLKIQSFKNKVLRIRRIQTRKNLHI